MKEKELKQKVKKITAEDYLALENALIRLQADFENYRRRTQKEKEEFGTYLNTDLILRMIPVMDNFQLALRHLPKEFEGNAWAQGIFHIERQLEQILADEGVQRIPTIGQKFDPHLHEAIEEVTSESPPHTIVEEMSNGYKLKDRVIRPAKVKVSKGNGKIQTENNKSNRKGENK
jgi:molecular chaperone GrpE